MRRHLTTLIATSGAVIGLTAVPSSALAKSCSDGYVRGVIGGEQKCLADGEFCSHEYASEYHRYGFDCVEYASGYYHLRPRS